MALGELVFFYFIHFFWGSVLASWKKNLFQAYKSDLYGARYVWILIGTYSHRWWSVPDPSLRCTKDEMRKAVAYTFIFNNQIFVSEDKKEAQSKTLSGLVSIWLILTQISFK